LLINPEKWEQTKCLTQRETDWKNIVILIIHPENVIELLAAGRLEQNDA
jgi:hypothetical protein